MENQNFRPQSVTQTLAKEVSASVMPVEFIELSLEIDLLLESQPSFADAVRTATAAAGGEFLFDLPHAASPEGKGRVAAVRIAHSGAVDRDLVFIYLSDDGQDTSVRTADGQPTHLRSFANSFVEVLEKFARH
jgi:hypothetical protein